MDQDDFGNSSKQGFVLIQCSYGAVIPTQVTQNSVLHPFYICASIYLSINAFSTVLMNALIIGVIFKSGLCRGRVYYKGLVYQTTLDLLTGLLVPTIYAKNLWNLLTPSSNNDEICLLWLVDSSLGYFFSGLSVNGIMFLTVERYYKICHATTYQQKFTPRWAALLMVLLWVPTAIFSCLLWTLHFTEANIIIIIESLTYLIIIPIMYYKIFQEVRRSRARVGAAGQQSARKVQEQQMAKKFFVIVVVLTICYMPNVVVSLNQLDTGTIAYHVIFTSTAISVLTNSFLNPVLYIWQDSQLRRKVRSTICYQEVRGNQAETT